MSKTSSTTRFSPLSSSINKNLLTPCRRIGLSRKRKTPNTVQGLLENSPISFNSGDSSHTETTPVNHEKSVKQYGISGSVEVTLPESSQLVNEEEIDQINCNMKRMNKTVPKKGLFQTFSEDLFQSNLSQTSSNNLEDVNLIREVPDSDLSFRENKPSQLKTSEENTYESNDSNDDFRITKKFRRIQKRQVVENDKKVKKKLSLKDTESQISKESVETSCIIASNITKECTVQLQKICENKINQHQEKPNICPTESCVTAVDVITDEDDEFTSTPEQEKHKKADLLKKIKALEEVTQQKRQHLADLKQALIYKKKHSIEDLNELTAKWTTGCTLGLNDLLTQLQAHGPMDMNTLLQNLHIPKDIVTKLNLNVD